jgi:hypothetical protein
LTSLGVPGQPLGNPPVVVFNLGRGGVSWGRPVTPVTGQVNDTPLRAGLTLLTLCVPVLGSRPAARTQNDCFVPVTDEIERWERFSQDNFSEFVDGFSAPPYSYRMCSL